MKIITSIVLSALLLSGCATLYVPPLPERYALPDNARIGLYVVANDHPKHTHIGTTVFNNFVKDYEYDWDMANLIYKIFKDQIERHTEFATVNLKDLNVDISNGIDLVDVKDKQWQYVEENTQLKNRLLEEGIYAVIYVVEKPTLALLNCSNYGCAEHQS